MHCLSSMKRVLFILILITVLPGALKAQSIPEYDFGGVEVWLNKNNDTTYVVNFWATWCKPCVEEIPGFLEVASELEDEAVKFVFVSLDFPGQKDSRLIPFVEKYGMADHLVILLNDPDSNVWINKVDADWSGAIPGTLVYKGTDRSFYEKSLSKEELKTIIKSK